MASFSTPPELADPLESAPSSYVKQGDDMAALMAREGELLARLKQDERDLEALNLLGVIYVLKAQYPKAEALYTQSLRLQPVQPVIWYNLGKLYRMTFRLDEAISCYNQGVKCDPNDALLYLELGGVLFDRGQWDKAIRVYRLLLGIQPDHKEATVMLATTLLAGGEAAQAAALCREKLVRRMPGQADLLRTLVMAECPLPEDAVFAPAEAVLRSEQVPLHTRRHIAYTLGQMYDRNARYAEAFPYFLQGAAWRLQELGKTPQEVMAQTEQYFSAIMHGCGQEHIHAAAEEEGAPVIPIFVLGMPRSGTSLLEQILASHTAVYGAGELSYLHRLATGKLYPRCMETLARAPQEERRSMAQDYLKRLATHKTDKPAARYIVDKLPSNFLYIGLIRLLFPQAKILHCTRDAMDTCLSIFQHDFHGLHQYAYHLETLGHYYAWYERLMAHWHHMFPGAILDVRYEDLTASPEEHIRAIAQFCGLDVEEAMLTPHQTRRDTRTASAAQVTQPIYRSSIARWRRYEQELAPLAVALERYSYSPSQ